MKGLFINQVKSQCSIYESGYMIYNALKSKDYTLDYREVPVAQIGKQDYSGYDFIIFNWHHNTLPISSVVLNRIKGLRIGIVLEVGPYAIRPFMPEDLFDAYMIIDPTKEKSGKNYVFPRPLEKVDYLLPLLSEDVPVFGTFGFLAPGKDFTSVLQQANLLGTPCILRMNFPDGTFTGQSSSMSKSFAEHLQRLKGPNVDLRITYDYMHKNALIRWCSQNSLNIFPYYRDLPGLSAVTDQAIVANRGIAITNCNTFRHMHRYIEHFPNQGYLGLSKSTLPGIKQMQEDWSNKNFVAKFQELLSERLK